LAAKQIIILKCAKLLWLLYNQYNIQCCYITKSDFIQIKQFLAQYHKIHKQSFTTLILSQTLHHFFT